MGNTLIVVKRLAFFLMMANLAYPQVLDFKDLEFGTTHKFIVRYKLDSKNIIDTVARPSKSFRKLLLEDKISQAELIGSQLCIRKSSIAQLGLFTASGTSYSAGDTIAQVFIKVGSTGLFATDYIETQYGGFVNHGAVPNAQVVFSTQGLAIVALKRIPSSTEISCSYSQLLSLFPGDKTIGFLIHINN